MTFTGHAVVILLAAVFMVLAWMAERNQRTSSVEAWVMFLAGLFFWSSGIGLLLWVVADGLWHEVASGHGLAVILAAVFLVLAWMVRRNQRSSVAESGVMFLSGLFFWASGLGVALWALLDGLWRLVGGHG
jgi:uncharacterized protein (TIGR03382 family)